MKVCDVCRRPISFPVEVKIKREISTRYEVCGKCAKKINKFIKYETARQKRKQVMNSDL